MKNHSLHQHLEMLSSEAITVLHDICSMYWWNTEAIYICGLQTNNKEVLLCFFPGHVKVVPAVFDNSQEDCMKDLDSSVL